MHVSPTQFAPKRSTVHTAGKGQSRTSHSCGAHSLAPEPKPRAARSSPQPRNRRPARIHAPLKIWGLHHISRLAPILRHNRTVVTSKLEFKCSESMQRGASVVALVGGAVLVAWLVSVNFKSLTMLGGKKEVDVSQSNTLEVDELANFAVSEHNKRKNSLETMKFSKVVSCQKQVVSGLMYHMVIEVEEGSDPKQYEAKVWVKPGGASKTLEEFKPKDGGLTSADMGVKSTGVPLTKVSRHSHGPPTGKQTVPTDDPVVQEAAERAVRMLQQGSNSLATYELSEIVSAEAELKDESANFELLLKTKRGSKEEHFRSEVHRTGDGQWSVKHATLQ